MAQDGFDLSERRACRLLQLYRSTHRYQARPRDDARLRQRLRELAASYTRWGSQMLTDLLRNEGFTDNHKRIWRIYAEEGLQVQRRRRRQKRYIATARVQQPVNAPDDRWSMDFVFDSFIDGRQLKALTAVDQCTRECLCASADRSIGSAGVIEALDSLKARGRTPKELQLDNGPEFRSRRMLKWCQDNGVLLRFIQPGKPTQNGHIESLNGTFREECLNENLFSNPWDARRKFDRWRRVYNTIRPHSSLGGATPRQRYQQLRSNPSV
jgi:putative transposase